MWFCFSCGQARLLPGASTYNGGQSACRLLAATVLMALCSMGCAAYIRVDRAHPGSKLPAQCVGVCVHGYGGMMHGAALNTRCGVEHISMRQGSGGRCIEVVVGGS